jgi:hypothetical protein
MEQCSSGSARVSKTAHRSQRTTGRTDNMMINAALTCAGGTAAPEDYTPAAGPPAPSDADNH